MVSGVTSGDRVGVLYDAMWDDPTCVTLLGSVGAGAELPTRLGLVRGAPGAVLQSPDARPDPVSLRRLAREQSNTSIIYGDRLILKLFRRCQPGINPDAEIDRFLTERAGFGHVPPFAGTLSYERDGASATLALLQGMVASEGDGWTGALEELQRYYEAWVSQPFPAETSDARTYVGIYLDSAATLGRRTAELHVALASAAGDPDFAPEPLTPDDVARLATGFGQRATEYLDGLKNNLPRLPDEAVEEAGLVLRRRREFLAQSADLPPAMGGRRIRIHGDYHLGQVLRARNDFVILDFEGEPARPVEERRAKHSPLKDVAGMLRSFSYAAYAALVSYTTRRPEAARQLEPWARLWERSASAAFLDAYRAGIAGHGLLPESPAADDALLRAYLVDKALYELHYELNNRPAWVRIPLWGLSSL